MASVLELQAISGGTTAVGFRSTVSLFRCGKDGKSSVSLAWCFAAAGAVG